MFIKKKKKIIVGLVASAFIGSAFALTGDRGDNGPDLKKAAIVGHKKDDGSDHKKGIIAKKHHDNKGPGQGLVGPEEDKGPMGRGR